jgi:hypothetical protein
MDSDRSHERELSATWSSEDGTVGGYPPLDTPLVDGSGDAELQAVRDFFAGDYARQPPTPRRLRAL